MLAIYFMSFVVIVLTLERVFIFELPDIFRDIKKIKKWIVILFLHFQKIIACKECLSLQISKRGVLLNGQMIIENSIEIVLLFKITKVSHQSIIIIIIIIIWMISKLIYATLKI